MNSLTRPQSSHSHALINTEERQAAVPVGAVMNTKAKVGKPVNEHTSHTWHSSIMHQLREPPQNIPFPLPQSISFLRATYATTRKQLMGQQQTLVCYFAPSFARLTGHRKTPSVIRYSVIRRFPLLGAWPFAKAMLQSSACAARFAVQAKQITIR